MILQAKFHVVSSLLSVLKIVILNLKRGTFVVIMFLNKSLTHIHPQKDPWLNFGKTFALSIAT